MPTGRADFVVVANRLPVDLERMPDGSLHRKRSPGGLVTALEPMLRSHGGAWVGWPGLADADTEPFVEDGLQLHPVRLSAAEVEDYYEGFSNATLWPLYHDVVAPPAFHRHWWQAYLRVNQRFAEVTAEVAAPGATVWVQDYQLQLLPGMLRALRPDLRIGFFLHIPFPPTELFMQLPWRARIIEGLLGADLVGFHTPGGARNFRWLATRLTGAVGGLGRNELISGGRPVRIGAFPISIDSAALDRLARTPEVQERAKQIRADLGDPARIMLGVDRLDYTKGIDGRLVAFEELLAEGRVTAEDAVLVQLATPSRERVGHYQKMRNEIEQSVGRINGEYSRIGHPAVHYLHQALPRDELVAFFLAADVMLVTPLRDGMNLVAKEYVACRHDDGGVLVLSEFAGAARELKEALLVNPHDTDGLKDVLHRALTISPADRTRRMRALRRQVMTHDVDRWARSFLTALGLPAGHRQGPVPPGLDAALRTISGVPKLLVALDFDGVLAPIVEVPSAARPLPAAAAATRAMALLPDTTVVLVSGRALADLAAVSGFRPPVRMVGSHGGEFDDGAAALVDERHALLDRVIAQVSTLIGDAPGVRLEFKPAGVAVHVRTAEPAVGARVLDAVRAGPASWPGVAATEGKAVLDLAVLHVSKGEALDVLRERFGADAAVYLGDDVTDESVFTQLRPGDVGVKVGEGDTAAAHRVAGPPEVAALLETLIEARRQHTDRGGPAAGTADSR